MKRRTHRLVALALACAPALVAPAGAGALSLGGPTNYPGGDFPVSVAIGEMNGDSIPDLAVLSGPPWEGENTPESQVSILLGETDGSFSAGAEYTVADQSNAVVAADFDGDDDLDVASAGWGPTGSTQGAVTLLLGAGDGTFAATEETEVAGQPQDIAVGDFDSDQDPDLAIAAGSDASVLLNEGDATFVEAPINDPADPSLVLSVATGEFGGEPGTDIVFGDGGMGNLFTVTLGDGGVFADPEDFVELPGMAWDIAVGEFNGDDRDDLAVAVGGEGGGLQVLPGAEVGGFGDGAYFFAGSEPRGVGTGDFDGDADQDIVVSDSEGDEVYAFEGNGQGSFTSDGDYEAGFFPSGIAVGDLFGNGLDDAVVANAYSQDVSILRGRAEPAVTAGATGTKLGGRMQVTASLEGAAAPTGTIAVRVYGPQDPGCAGPPVDTIQVVPGLVGTLAPTQLGTYYLEASYPGDPGNTAADGACVSGAAVTQATPSLALTAPAAGRTGAPVAATASLTGGSSPDGQIVFSIYGPRKPLCAGPPVFTQTIQATGNRTYQSPAFVPEDPGVYAWTASYSGDAQNQAASTPCGSAAAVTVVALAPKPKAGCKKAKRGRGGKGCGRKKSKKPR